MNKEKNKRITENIKRDCWKADIKGAFDKEGQERGKKTENDRYKRTQRQAIDTRVLDGKGIP